MLKASDCACGNLCMAVSILSQLCNLPIESIRARLYQVGLYRKAAARLPAFLTLSTFTKVQTEGLIFLHLRNHESLQLLPRRR